MLPLPVTKWFRYSRLPRPSPSAWRRMSFCSALIVSPLSHWFKFVALPVALARGAHVAVLRMVSSRQKRGGHTACFAAGALAGHCAAGVVQEDPKGGGRWPAARSEDRRYGARSSATSSWPCGMRGASSGNYAWSSLPLKYQRDFRLAQLAIAGDLGLLEGVHASFLPVVVGRFIREPWPAPMRGLMVVMLHSRLGFTFAP